MEYLCISDKLRMIVISVLKVFTQGLKIYLLVNFVFSLDQVDYTSFLIIKADFMAVR